MTLAYQDRLLDVRGFSCRDLVSLCNLACVASAPLPIQNTFTCLNPSYRKGLYFSSRVHGPHANQAIPHTQAKQVLLHHNLERTVDPVT